VKKMLPIPAVPDSAFKEAQPFTDQGLHGKLYRFSPDDFKGISAIWYGEHPIDGRPLEVEDGTRGGQAIDPQRRGWSRLRASTWMSCRRWPSAS
jgi:Mn-containing catalase